MWAKEGSCWPELLALGEGSIRILWIDFSFMSLASRLIRTKQNKKLCALFLWRSWWLCNQNKNKPSWRQAAWAWGWPPNPFKRGCFMLDTAEIYVGLTGRHIIHFLPRVYKACSLMRPMWSSSEHESECIPPLSSLQDKVTSRMLVECGGRETAMFVVPVCVWLKTAKTQILYWHIPFWASWICLFLGPSPASFQAEIW